MEHHATTLTPNTSKQRRACVSTLVKTNTKQRKIPQKELLILWAIQGTGKSGTYGLDIQRAIAEASNGNEELSVGTLYSLLKRLRGKGYVDSYEGDALGGGAKRQYYFLTEEGISILKAFDDFQSKLQRWTPRQN